MASSKHPLEWLAEWRAENDPELVTTDFERRLYEQQLARQLARERNKPDLFDGPEAA